MKRMAFSVLLVVSLALAAACSSHGMGVRSSGGSPGTGGSAGGAISSGGTSTGGVVGGQDAGGASDVAASGDSGKGTEASADSAPPDARADVSAREQDSGAEANNRAGCEAPPGIENGSVSAPDTAFGSVVTYACNPGFSLTGAPTCTCQADGTWSGTAPTCTADMLKLTINKTGTGTGTVSSAPAGIACGSSCQATFAAGTAVTLTAKNLFQ